MKIKKEIEEIRALYEKKDYEAVCFLVKDRADLKEQLLPEYCISGIYTDDIDSAALDNNLH